MSALSIPSSQRADLRACRMAAGAVFLVLPLLHYGAMEAIYQQIHNDLAFVVWDTILSYWLQIVGDLFPCFGLAVLTVTLCRAGRDRMVILFAYIGTLLPYLCMLAALFLADAAFFAHIGRYLLYLLFPALEDILLLTLVLFLCLVFLRARAARDRLHTVQYLTAVLLLFRALIPEVVTTIRFIYEILYEYYDVITSADVVEIVLNYLYRIAIVVASFGIMRLFEWLLTRRNGCQPKSPQAEKAL